MINVPYQYYPQYQMPYQPPMADQLTQLRQQQYQPPMQQPVMQQAQPAQQTGGIIWVQGEEGAKAYMVAPGNTVLLMDSDGSSFYLKSADASGMPQPLRIFDYVERQAGANRHAQEPMQDMGQFVTRQEFEALQAQIDALTAQKQPVKKATAKEGTQNG